MDLRSNFPDILKSNELLPYLKMPEQDKRAHHDLFKVKALWLAGLKQTLVLSP